jgi:signal transduction histidine kinase
VDLGDDGRLAPELETTIYRVVQEALTNAGRHADASTVDVRVWRQDEVVLVRVADDGRGVDPERLAEGFGLTGMRERVALAGGELELEPADPGACVSARLPVTPP